MMATTGRSGVWLGSTLAMSLIAAGIASCGDKSASNESAIQQVTDISSPPSCCEVELPARVPAVEAPKAEEANPTEAGEAAVQQPTEATADTGAPAEVAQAQSGARPSAWLAPEEREDWDFNFDFKDQDGRDFNLSTYLGKPLAMSFIFTRCSNPYMCPMITVQMANLELALKEAGLEDKVNLVLLTYDPVYDTPERLKRYGQDRGIKFTSTKMLQPDMSQFRNLLYEFGIDARFNPQGGVANHGMDLYLFDKLGRRVRYYTGGVWDNAEVIQDLKKLLDEPLEVPVNTDSE